MTRLGRTARLVVAGLVVAAALAAGVVALRALTATTRLLDRGDQRFDVLVQRRAERFDDANARLLPPHSRPRLSAAQAWSIADVRRVPDGGKPSLVLATFDDPDFPVPAGPGRRLVPRPRRALVWVVIVPDVPIVEFGAGSPEFGPDFRADDASAGQPARQAACPTYTPVDATTGQPFGTWHHC
jgi:hypothetical protein